MNDLPEIKLLSNDIINLIAAGEVIERPASVIKELLENAIDAKSTKIKIELLESGIKHICVIDDGIGMSKEQIGIAVLQHTTSKIHTEDDLFNIASLGFRGEALASIKQISIMEITSSTDGLNGYYHKYKGGTLLAEGPTAMPKGTKIVVDNLFFNTPARYRNLGNPYVELSHITSIVEKIAMANPNISISLYNNNNLLLKTDGGNNLNNIIGQIYGLNVAKNIIPFSGKNDFYTIDGYTSTNNVFRSNRNSINIIVNGRTIRNLKLIYAITDAYKSIIPVNKYPITVLNIHCNHDLIDVNVHPSKLEIRFTDENNLRDLITRSIANAIKGTSLVYDVRDDDLNLFKTKTVNEQPVDEILIKEEQNKNIKEKTLDELWEEFSLPTDNNEHNQIDLNKEENEPIIEEKEIKNESNQYIQEDIKLEKKSFSSLRYIGQYHRLYLILEDDNDLYLIDQHAAMERWMYERIYDAFLNSKNESYELLIPLKLDFKLSDIEMINAKKDLFANVGLEIEPFGGTTIIVRRVPIWVPTDDPSDFVYEIIQNFIQNNEVNKAIMYDHLAKQLACKRSIKAKMHILEEEVYALLKNLDSCKMPYTCPHGRPVMVKISSYEMEKMFKRVI